MNYADFAKNHDLSLTWARVKVNPHMPDFKGDNYQVKLSRPAPLVEGPATTRFSLFFSKGYGLNGEPPAIEEVLNCLALDLSIFQGDLNMPFEDWCSEMGYDPDSRKALKTFKACRDQAVAFTNFLGEELVEELVFTCEEE